MKTIETGPTQTMNISEPLPNNSNPVNVILKMGAGKLNLNGGADNLVTGAIEYNIANWRPTITNQNNTLSITQEVKWDGGFPGNNLVNDWNLKFGPAPLKMEIQAGAYEGTLDLSGIPIQSLDISGGASSSKIIFDRQNPVKMSALNVKTGASSLKMNGLAYANFSNMSFEAGAGSYNLDFSGQLQQDAFVHIIGGVSSTKIIIPEGMKCKVEVTGGLNNVTINGTWTGNQGTYTTNGSGPLLSIKVDLGVGSLELSHS